MYPTLFKIGPFPIRSWGVMLAIAFVVGIIMAQRRAKRYGIETNFILDLSILILVSSIVGARIAYVIDHFDFYFHNPSKIFGEWESGLIFCGGLIFYGGILLAIPVSIFYARKRKVSVPKLMDVLTPSLAIGLFFARIGCFLNGCCFGKPTNLPIGITCPEDSPAGWIFNVPIHATQLYSAVAGLAMFFILMRIEKVKKFDGALFWYFLGMYGIWRFFVDFLRYYEPSEYIMLDLTFNQIISLLILIFSVWRIWYGRKVVSSRT